MRYAVVDRTEGEKAVLIYDDGTRETISARGLCEGDVVTISPDGSPVPDPAETARRREAAAARRRRLFKRRKHD